VTVRDTYLLRGKRLDHALFGGHAPDPTIAFDAH